MNLAGLNQFDMKNLAKEVLDTFKCADKFETLYSSHKAWWENYWAESEITIPDKKVEDLYYISYYLYHNLILL